MKKSFYLGMVLALLCPALRAGTPTIVQYKSDGQMDTTTANIQIYLPEPTPVAGNMLFFVCTSGITSQTMTVSDSTAGSNTWVAGPSQNDSTNTQTMLSAYALNVASGTQWVKAAFGSTGNAKNQCQLFEYFNIPTSSATDGTSSGNVANGTVTSGSITTGTSGDLIIQAAYCTSCSHPVTSPYTWTAGTGFQLRTADGASAFAVQDEIQASAGAISPTMTLGVGGGGSITAVQTIAIAFKPGSAGGNFASGIHVLSIQNINLPSHLIRTSGLGTLTLQYPTFGNAIAFNWNGAPSGEPTITSSPSNTWTTHKSCANGNSNNDEECWWPVQNPSVASTMTVTGTYSSSQLDTSAVMVDMTGASTSSLFDTAMTNCSGSLSATSGTVTCNNSITPAAANELMLGASQEQGNTVSTGTPGNFAAERVDGYSNNTADKDEGVFTYITPSTSAITPTITFVNTEGSTQVQSWWAEYILLKPAGAAAASPHGNAINF